MNIGEVAKQTGFSAKMIRYYEDIGLIDAAKRTDAGYRIYTEQDVKTLNFIRHARELGFSAEQMKGLISLWKNTDRSSAEVQPPEGAGDRQCGRSTAAGQIAPLSPVQTQRAQLLRTG